MPEITDVENEFIREEIEEYLEQPNEIERAINTFSQISSAMQEIAAALLMGIIIP